jgi:hypothetical protein
LPTLQPSHRRRAALAAGIVVIAAIGIAIVAVGLRAPASPPLARVLPEPDPAPWIDIRWDRIDPPAMGGPLNQSVYQIVQGGPGMAVLGTDADGDPGAQTSMATVWTSRDGRDWVKSRLLDGVAGPDTSEAQVIAAMPGALVVSGGVCCTVEEQRAMWWSADGQAWERLVLPLEMQGVTFLSMAAGPDGFVGVGVSHLGNPNDPTEMSELWTSPTGRDWARVDPAGAGLDLGSVSDVAWTGTHWVAVGKQSGGETWDGAVWRSADLIGWSRVAAQDPALVGADEVELGRVVAFPGGILAAGGRGTHEDRVACEGLLGVAGPPDAVLVLSCGWLRTEHLWSADGLAWRRLQPIEPAPGGPALPPGPGGRRLISHRVMAPGGPGLVVVDAEAHDQDLPGDLVGTWTSVDGDTWRPVGRSPQLPMGLYLNDIVVSGRTIIGIGDSEWDQPTGPDGVVWIGTVIP